MNPPTLDDIMKRERRMIQLKRAIEEEKESQLTIKTRTGKTIPMPKLYPNPMEAGINIENGIPTKPVLDFELRRRKRKHGSRSEEI
jgi:hypothetical protein